MEITESSVRPEQHEPTPINPDTHGGHDHDATHASEGFSIRESIIIPAWELVTHESSVIKKFNFFPSLLSTIYLGVIVLYQLAFSYVYVFQLKDQFFALIIEWSHTVYFWQVLAALAVGFFLYIWVVPMAEIGLVSLISKKSANHDDPAGYGYGISRGFLYFLPIFELTNIMSLFKLLSIITFYLFLLRVFGREYFTIITIIVIVYLLFAFVVNMLLSYSRFFVIFEDKKAFQAVSASVKMALDSLDVTFHLYFTLLLVYIRTILTVVAFIIFPFIASALLTYITISALQYVAIGILLILFFAFLVFVSHLNSVLEIFVESIWYNAYKENKSRLGSGGSSDSHGHDDHGHH